MIKKTITVKCEIITKETGEIVSRKIDKKVEKETVDAKYLVPHSNFWVGDSEVMLSGIPCKVVGEPYIRDIWTWDYRLSTNVRVAKSVVDVVSCVTGLRYYLPADSSYIEEFLTVKEANKVALVKGHSFPNEDEDCLNLIDKSYWPRSNSYISNLTSKYPWKGTFLVGHECTIVSTPYRTDFTTPMGNVVNKMFIKVQCDGDIFQVPFEEWCLANRSELNEDSPKRIR